MSIQVKNLTHIYEKGMPNESIALENISFEVEDGSFLGVIGHTGSGKSTLLQHLNGLLKPTEGTIVIGGVDITSPDVSMVDIRKRIGLVFQYPEYQLFEETVERDIAFGPKNMGLCGEELEKRVMETCEIIGVKEEYLQKLNDDILTWLGNSEKIIETNWYQTSGFGYGTKYISMTIWY